MISWKEEVSSQENRAARCQWQELGQNAGLCSGCGKGRHLYCCDGYPWVWHAGCLHGKGGVPLKSEGEWYRPCYSQERARVGVPPTSGQRRGTVGEEGEVQEQWVGGVKREEARQGTYLQVPLGCI